jgi:hypothetical protein
MGGGAGTAASDAPLDSPGFAGVLAAASAAQSGPTDGSGLGVLAGMLVSGENLDLLAMLDDPDIPAELQGLLDALNAIMSEGVDASDEESLTTLFAQIEALFAATDENVVEDLLTRLEVAIGVAEPETKGSPTRPASTPAATVIANVPAAPRPFAIATPSEAPANPTAPPAPPALDGTSPNPVPPGLDGAQTTTVAVAGKSGVEAPVAAAPVIAAPPKLGPDGKKSPASPIQRPAFESLPASDRPLAVAVDSPVITGETPTTANGVQVVPADSSVTDRPVMAVVGPAPDEAAPAAVEARPASTNGVTITATPPAATVEITATNGEAPNATGITTAISNDAPIAATVPTAAVVTATEIQMADSVASTGGRVDVAEQIVRHARVTIAQGGGTATMQLQPPELGKLDLEIAVGKDGVVTMHVVSHNQEARFLVQSQLADLQQSLQDQGLEVGEFSVSVHDESETAEREAAGGSGTAPDGAEDMGTEVPEYVTDAPPLLAFAGYGALDFSA